MGYSRDDVAMRACLFAVKMHFGQTRLNKDRTPLIDHVAEVASLVKESGGSTIEIAASWLHDIVEDTKVTFADIVSRFGQAIGDIVDGLTDPPEFKGLHTLERKIKQAERIRFKSDSIKRIKVADQVSNIRAVAVDPPVKWDHKKCLDYTEGAGRICQECLGVSRFLDKEFEEAYSESIKVHSAVSWRRRF